MRASSARSVRIWNGCSSQCGGLPGHTRRGNYGNPRRSLPRGFARASRARDDEESVATELNLARVHTFGTQADPPRLCLAQPPRPAASDSIWSRDAADEDRQYADGPARQGARTRGDRRDAALVALRVLDRIDGQKRMIEIRLLTPIECWMSIENLQATHQEHGHATEHERLLPSVARPKAVRPFSARSGRERTFRSSGTFGLLRDCIRAHRPLRMSPNACVVLRGLNCPWAPTKSRAVRLVDRRGREAPTWQGAPCADYRPSRSSAPRVCNKRLHPTAKAQ
jgi:hypothetical protein